MSERRRKQKIASGGGCLKVLTDPFLSEWGKAEQTHGSPSLLQARHK